MDPQQLEAAIAALQAQRGLLGDAVVDTALGPTREQLARLLAAAPEAAGAAQKLKQVTVLPPYRRAIFTGIVRTAKGKSQVNNCGWTKPHEVARAPKSVPGLA